MGRMGSLLQHSCQPMQVRLLLTDDGKDDLSFRFAHHLPQIIEEQGVLFKAHCRLQRRLPFLGLPRQCQSLIRSSKQGIREYDWR